MQPNRGTYYSYSLHLCHLFLLLPFFPVSRTKAIEAKLSKNEFGHVCHLKKRRWGVVVVAGARPPPLHQDHLLLSPDWP